MRKTSPLTQIGAVTTVFAAFVLLTVLAPGPLPDSQENPTFAVVTESSANLNGPITEEYRIDTIRAFRVAGLDTVPYWKSANVRFRDEEKHKIGSQLDASVIVPLRYEGEAKNGRRTFRIYDRRKHEFVSDSSLLPDPHEGSPSSITRTVAGLYGLTLAADKERFLGQIGTSSIEAYYLYWEARTHWGRRTESALLESVRLFKEAIKKDEGFAQAYCPGGCVPARRPG